MAAVTSGLLSSRKERRAKTVFTSARQVSMAAKSDGCIKVIIHAVFESF